MPASQSIHLLVRLLFATRSFFLRSAFRTWCSLLVRGWLRVSRSCRMRSAFLTRLGLRCSLLVDRRLHVHSLILIRVSHRFIRGWLTLV